MCPNIGVRSEELCKMKEFKLNIKTIECIFAIVASIVSMYLMIQFSHHAGGLWRDEANTIRLSETKSLQDLVANLQFDSFPAGWILFLKIFYLTGFNYDYAYRMLGLFVGLLIILSVWINAFYFKYKYPYISIALIGLSPLIFYWGCSMRAYGAGLIFTILLIPTTWNYVILGGYKKFAVLLITSIISVQLLYYNSLVLLSCTVSGCAVLLINKSYKRILFLVSIGFISALTVIPYIAITNKVNKWDVLSKLKTFGFGYFCTKFYQSININGDEFAVMYLLFIGFVVLIGISAVFKNKKEIIYSLTLIISYPMFFYIFLRILKWPTQPWYYITIFSILAIAGEIILKKIFIDKKVVVYVSLIYVVIVIAVPFNRADCFSKLRITNVDLAAKYLNSNTLNGDLIILYPWYNGISFNRYYNGCAKWVTIPNIKDHFYHRYDLIKNLCESPDQVKITESLKSEIITTLKNNKNTYSVGPFSFFQQMENQSTVLPAPFSAWGWSGAGYEQAWSVDVLRYLSSHSLKYSIVSSIKNETTIGVENLFVVCFSGWRDD